MTPEQLAAELGISGKTLRAWLRRNFPRPPGEKWSSWTLSPEHIAAAHAWRAGSRRPSPQMGGNHPPRMAPAPTSKPGFAWDPRVERSFRGQDFLGFVSL